MIHVLLDTNIYRQDPKREKLPFKALVRMSKNAMVKLHIPYIVENEFVTHLEEHYETNINEANGGIASLLKYALPDGYPEMLLDYSQNLSTLNDSAKAFIKEDFAKWAEEMSAIRYELNSAHTGDVINSYFSGSAPYKTKKARKDIPDAFIFEFIKELLNDDKELHFIANDGCLGDACNGLEKVLTYKSLEKFIESEMCQKLLLDTSVIEEFKHIVDYVKGENDFIESYLDGAHIDCLAGETIYDTSIPDDNGEAHISMVGSAEGIEIDYDSAVYCGDGEIKIPFAFSSEVLTYYFIFKSDYYCLSEEKQEKICGVQDWNDHYYEAEEYYSVDVFGDLKIPIDLTVIEESKNYADLILFDDISIDSVNKIRVSEDDT